MKMLTLLFIHSDMRTEELPFTNRLGYWQYRYYTNTFNCLSIKKIHTEMYSRFQKSLPQCRNQFSSSTQLQCFWVVHMLPI